MASTADSSRAMSQRVTICNKRGLHARASARLVRTAECFNADIFVTKDGVTVSGTSIMGLMMLAAGPGSTLVIQAKGSEARRALEAVVELIHNGFDEDNEGDAAAGG